jgi:DUF177 domain-containing protein
MRRFDLRSLRLADGGETWRRLPLDVDPFVFGGLEYAVTGAVADALLTVSRVSDRLTVTLEFGADVRGPCQRCLGDADVQVAVRGLEYCRHGDAEGDEEDQGYVAGYIVDLEGWARDLIADALPAQLLCRDDCRGLCPVCGADLNADPGHRHE